MRPAQPTPRKSLRGLWRGLDITEQDIAAARSAMCQTHCGWLTDRSLWDTDSHRFPQIKMENQCQSVLRHEYSRWKSVSYFLHFAKREPMSQLDLEALLRQNLTLTGEAGEINQVLEHAGRVADFLEFADVMVEDALTREESCGCHFREEYQTEDNEALRNDSEFSHAAVWEFTGVGEAPALHKESLVFEHVELTRRSYK